MFLFFLFGGKFRKASVYTKQEVSEALAKYFFFSRNEWKENWAQTQRNLLTFEEAKKEKRKVNMAFANKTLNKSLV